LLVANLNAHGDDDLAIEVGTAIHEGELDTGLMTKLEGISEEIQICKYSAGRELAVGGLAGLQYRVFFSHLLPAYSSTGVPGAEVAINHVNESPQRRGAIARLQALYADEEFITSLPMEL
jgi:hypothetical protein